MALYVEPFPVVLVDCAYVGSLNLYQALTPCRLACNAVCAAGGATRGVLECVRMAGAAADCHAGAPAVADRCKNGINTYEALWCHQCTADCDFYTEHVSHTSAGAWLITQWFDRHISFVFSYIS